MSSASSTPTPMIELRHVSKRFGERPIGHTERALQKLRLSQVPAITYAVDDVNLIVNPGEVVGLVGESGCGKSTLGRIAAGLMPPSDGEVWFNGVRRDQMTPEQAHEARLKAQLIFQDPYASLNPRLRVDQIIGEAPLIHGLTTRADMDDYVSAQMQRAGLDPQLRQRYPHQFSGGQRQRIGIARALAVQPSVLICDEAVAALDVSIQAQILNLFMDLREELNLTYLFISHDLGVVEHISDRVVIMYLGRVVESAPAEDVFKRANHPYTQALLAEIPRMNARRKAFTAIHGEIPSPLNPPSGCHFHPRCPHVMPRCKTEVPKLKGIAINHLSACHLNDGK
jgi:peptide/nickel transport system ATP-binding protein